MDRDELFEEIRSLLLEPQQATVTNPWHYEDADLIPQIRSALRYLRVAGVNVSATMALDGTITGDLTETQGILLSTFVGERLILGDLIQKLADGELGSYFKAGSDVLDNRDAATYFTKVADTYRLDFQAVLSIALSNADGGTNSVFSGTTDVS